MSGKILHKYDCSSEALIFYLSSVLLELFVPAVWVKYLSPNARFSTLLKAVTVYIVF